MYVKYVDEYSFWTVMTEAKEYIYDWYLGGYALKATQC